MRLYEIKAEMEALTDPETGELLDYEAFAALEMARDEKIEQMALWYKDMVADAEKLKAEERELAERRRALAARSERLKGYIDRELAGEGFKTSRCVVSYRKTTAVQIDNPAALIRWAQASGHGECLRYKEPEIDKAEVKRLIASGVGVPSASIRQGLSMGVK